MRNIEQEMIDAIRDGRSFKKDNTRVEHLGDGTVEVFLHGNLIASINKQSIQLWSRSWKTVTTKSRLNALLSEFTSSGGIYQRNYQWFVGDIKFEEGMTLNTLGGV